MKPVVIKASTDCLKKVIKERNLLLVFHYQNKILLTEFLTPVSRLKKSSSDVGNDEIDNRHDKTVIDC